MSESSSQPTRSLAHRLWLYLAEMFPPWTYVPLGMATFAGSYFLLQAVAGAETLVFPWRAWLGACTVVLSLLLLRIFDELKDIETDIRLGKAGDPRYKDRAVVTGVVSRKDIEFLRWLVTALLFALNLPMGFPWPLLAFGLLYLMMWLSYRWFFWPAISKNLLLAFVTHNPLMLVLIAYVIAVFVADFGTEPLNAWSYAILAAFWMPVAAWETARKIRHPDEETDYQTYTMLLGTKVAPMLPLLFTATTTACLIALGLKIELSWIYLAILLATTLLVVASCLRFLIAPSPAAAKLQPVVELYMTSVTIGLTITVWIQFGVEL